MELNKELTPSQIESVINSIEKEIETDLVSVQENYSQKWIEGISFLTKDNVDVSRLCFFFNENQPSAYPEGLFNCLIRGIIGQVIPYPIASMVSFNMMMDFGLQPEGYLKLTEDYFAETLEKISTDIGKINEYDMRSSGMVLKHHVTLIHSLANWWKKNNIDASWFTQFKNINEVLNSLHEADIKGIGHWTVAVFAIYGIRSLNIFSINDPTICRSFAAIYNGGVDVGLGNGKRAIATMGKDKVLNIINSWGNYKTIMQFYLWKFADGNYTFMIDRHK